MQDRFAELHTNVKPIYHVNDDHELVEVKIDVDESVPVGLEDFNNDVEHIKQSIFSIASQIEILENGFKSVILSTNPAAQEQINEDLEHSIEIEVNATAADLKRMSAENKRATSHIKWRVNIQSLITNQFMEILTRYRTIQNEYREKIKERIRERVLIVNPEANSEEVEKIVVTGNLNVFADELAKQNLGLAKESLHFVERRHEELLLIEKNVNELQCLFTDMAVLVESQGMFLDNIENNVSQTVVRVEEANKELQSAVKLKNRNRWWCCCLVISFTFLAAIGVILFIIFGNASGWWAGK